MEWLDPAIIDESIPFGRDPSLDAFNKDNGPPFPAEFVERYRAAQLARNRRITTWAEQQLAQLEHERHWPQGQWSVDRSNGNALLWLPKLETPVLVVGGSADSGSPPVILGQLYDAVQTARRQYVGVPGATHYFQGQPDLLRQACEAMVAW